MIDKILAGFFLALLATSVIAGAWQIDRPRKPLTAGTYVWVLGTSVILAYLLIRAYF